MSPRITDQLWQHFTNVPLHFTLLDRLILKICYCILCRAIVFYTNLSGQDPKLKVENVSQNTGSIVETFHQRPHIKVLWPSLNP